MDKELPQVKVVRASDNTPISIIIPQCCQEGWPTCPHVVNKKKKVKRNVGM